MKTTLRIRILIDTEDDRNVFRDIEIPSFYTLEKLHLAIQDCFNLDNFQMASFYVTDETWERGEEIMLMDMRIDDQSDKSRIMADTVIDQVLDKPNDKMLYIFDFLLMWTFFIEVVSIGTFSDKETYPITHLSVGDPPDQNSKSAEDLFGSMKYEMESGEFDQDQDEDEDFDEFDLENNYPSY